MLRTRLAAQAPFLALALASCDPLCSIRQVIVLDPAVGPAQIQERLEALDFEWESPYLTGEPEPGVEVRPARLFGAGWFLGIEWIASRHTLELSTGKITTDFSAEEVAIQVRAHERVFERLAPLLSPRTRAHGVLLLAEGCWDDEELQEHLEQLRASGVLGPDGARTPAAR
jgi:hypothetical protein